ncbi:unnamed protein product [Arabis nemorensis]|uniref:Uncharacterized protein n=1 Tax=Arabis nemorensis TaxID=586526 RepID=A0A565BRX1_9BRAS|nr:unnamed protein product [Arabis nemorensis]
MGHHHDDGDGVPQHVNSPRFSCPMTRRARSFKRGGSGGTQQRRRLVTTIPTQALEFITRSIYTSHLDQRSVLVQVRIFKRLGLILQLSIKNIRRVVS